MYYTLLIQKRDSIKAQLIKEPDCKILQRQLKNVNKMILEHKENVCQRVFSWGLS